MDCQSAIRYARDQSDKFTFGATAVVSLCFGLFASLAVVVATALLESRPKRKRFEDDEEQRVVVTALRDFRFTWYVLWVALAFGAWVFWTPVARWWLWALLLGPCIVAQLILSYWLPVISWRFTRIRTEHAVGRFVVLGTWFCDEMECRWLPGGRLAIEFEGERGWTHIVCDPTKPMRFHFILLADGILIGRCPPVAQKAFMLTRERAEKTTAQPVEKTGGAECGGMST